MSYSPLCWRVPSTSAQVRRFVESGVEFDFFLNLNDSDYAVRALTLLRRRPAACGRAPDVTKKVG